MANVSSFYTAYWLLLLSQGYPSLSPFSVFCVCWALLGVKLLLLRCCVLCTVASLGCTMQQNLTTPENAPCPILILLSHTHHHLSFAFSHPLWRPYSFEAESSNVNEAAV